MTKKIKFDKFNNSDLILVLKYSRDEFIIYNTFMRQLKEMRVYYDYILGTAQREVSTIG